MARDGSMKKGIAVLIVLFLGVYQQLSVPNIATFIGETAESIIQSNAVEKAVNSSSAFNTSQPVSMPPVVRTSEISRGETAPAATVPLEDKNHTAARTNATQSTAPERDTSSTKEAKKTSDEKAAVNTKPRGKPSILHYKACCGLGHRLVRMAAANYVAKARFNFGLTALWGHCDKTEVFKHLFEPEDLTNVTHDSRLLTIGNEVPGFVNMPHHPPKDCLCKQDEIDVTYQFYKSLIERFRFREKVDAFKEENFAGKTVIGMHIRAGNGETGDFSNKKRGIDDARAFQRLVIERIQELVSANQEIFDEKPPVLFIATDTQSMIDRVRADLNDTMPVVDLPQHRPEEGKGVLFGEFGKVANDGEVCLTGWEESVADMMLLALSDVVLATRYSSFVQSMPISVACGRSNFPTPYCELEISGRMNCFESFMDWCCHADGKKPTKVQVRDFWERPDSIYTITMQK